MLETTRTTTVAVRALFARLSLGVSAPAEGARVLAPVRETDQGRWQQARDNRDPATGRRRAEAHAAFRAVAAGPEPAAIDAALDVVEAEVDRLRRTVLAYGEALKSIEVYGACDGARRTAQAALRRAPTRLRSAPPASRVDHFARDSHG